MKINFYATLRDIVGAKAVDFPLEHGITARKVIGAIIDRYPAIKKELLQEDGSLYGHVHFFINGRDVQFLEGGMDTQIKPEDVITVFPAVGGG
jgi:molybdopterin synthase sulfur carrier subunit